MPSRRGVAARGVVTTFKTVDTCAAEFEATTPYHYSTYEDTTEGRALGARPGHHPGFGAEPDRPGHRVRLLLRARVPRPARTGLESVMVNCNPETVSTDYSTSDRLYFEPLTPEDVAAVIAAERAACVHGARLLGVIVSLGGQTPLKLPTRWIPPSCSARRSPRSTQRRTASAGRRSARRSDCASHPVRWPSPSKRRGP